MSKNTFKLTVKLEIMKKYLKTFINFRNMCENLENMVLNRKIKSGNSFLKQVGTKNYYKSLIKVQNCLNWMENHKKKSKLILYYRKPRHLVWFLCRNGVNQSENSLINLFKLTLRLENMKIAKV